MLRFSLRVSRLDKIRNEYIRGTTHVRYFGDKVRKARLIWFGHVGMLRMKPPGRRQRETPKKRFMDAVNEDMTLVGVRVEDAEMETDVSLR